MEEIKYVVKSHQRVDRFRLKTYNEIILKYNFNLKNTFVFVSTEEDYILYKEHYPEINIIKGPKGVAAIDNFITEYFAEGQKLIYMNDDVSGIYGVDDNLKKYKISLIELNNLINKAFDIMLENGITYGGLYPVLNTLFMSGGSDIKCDFGLIMDPFSFIVNNKNIVISISDKSDFEKSIQHFKDRGALLRFNRYSLNVEYYGKKGGFQGRDKTSEIQTANELVKKYPYYCNSVNIKNEGKTSIRFNKIKTKNKITYKGQQINVIENTNQTSLF